MEFWSYDEEEFFEDSDGGENTESIDEGYIKRFSKWLERKKRLGMELSPEDLSKIEEVIDNCIESGYFKQALRFCNTLLQYNPTSSDLLVKKGFVLINLRDYQNATNTLEEALTINPNNSNGLIFLSLIHFNEGNFEKSLNLLDKVLSFEPNNFALYNKAIVLQAYQQFDDALEIFQKLLNDERYKIEALQEISHILFLQGKYEESLNANLEALEIEPDNFWHWFNLGHCYLELGRFYKSIDAFQNAIALNPDFEYSYLYLGWAYTFLGRYKQAIHSFLAYSRRTFDKFVYFQIGNLLGDCGFYKQAIKFYQIVTKVDFSFAPAHIGIGLCYEKLMDYKKAEEAYKIGTSLDPKKPKYWRLAARNLLNQRKFSKALSTFSVALTNNPNDVKLLIDFRYAVEECKRYKEAIEILETIKPLAPENQYIHYMLGELYALTKQFDKSMDSFAKSFSLDKTLKNAIEAFIDILSAKRGYKKFIERLNLFLILNTIELPLEGDIYL